MLTRPVTVYPFGHTDPLPGPPHHSAVDQYAGESGMPPASRFEGQQDTLGLTGPVGAGDQGYMGRDILSPGPYDLPLSEAPGMFWRLHTTGDE